MDKYPFQNKWIVVGYHANARRLKRIESIYLQSQDSCLDMG